MCLPRSLLASAIVTSLLLCTSGELADHEVFKSKLYEATIDRNRNRGKCTQEITIKGGGVEDTFTEGCVENLEVLSNDDLIVVGNPQKNPYSLMCFSDTENVVVTVTNGKCNMKIYTTEEGQIVSFKTPIEDEVCEDLKMKVSKKMAGNDNSEVVTTVETEKGDTKQDDQFSVDIQTFDRRGKSFLKVTVKGNGVDDSFTGPCDGTCESLDVVNSGGVLVVGKPEVTPFSLYSDNPETIVMLKDGECKKMTYVTENGKTTSSSSFMEDDECEEVVEKINTELEKNKRKTEKDGKNPIEKFEVVTDSMDKRGKCIQEIKVKGNGVEDVFRGPCGKMNIVNNKGVLIIGDLDKAPFCLFSDKTDTLVVMRDGECAQRSYTTAKGKTTSTSAVMDDEECVELEEKVKQELKKKKSEQDNVKYSVTKNSFDRRGKCIEEINVKGNGVEDTFRGPCVGDMNVINTKGILVVGDVEDTPFSLFADQPNTLVIFKDGECKRRSYTTTNGKTTSTSTILDDEKCEEVERKLKKEQEKDKRNKGTSTPADSLYHVDMKSRTTNSGRCVQEIKINGNGIDDVFKGPCVGDLEVKRTKDILIIGEPNTSPFCMFSDERQTLIILRNGECKERKYTTQKNKTTQKTRVMGTDECKDVEIKIAGELEDI